MNNDSRILVAGAKGMVGSAIVRNLESKGYTNVIEGTRNNVDFTNQYETEKYLLNNQDILADEDTRCQAKSYAKKPIAQLYGVKQQLLEYLDKRSFKFEENNYLNYNCLYYDHLYILMINSN